MILDGRDGFIAFPPPDTKESDEICKIRAIIQNYISYLNVNILWDCMYNYDAWNRKVARCLYIYSFW